MPKLKFADLEPVGPGTPAGRYLRMFWHPVYRAKDLPAGRAKPIEILGEKFTLYRGETGTAHVVDYRCAHRAAPLTVGWVEGDDIRCRYHGWRFDCSGKCVEQPNNDNPTLKARIKAYPTIEYLGLVFAYLGDGKPPPFRRYPLFEKPGVVITDPPEVIPCSFWNRVDNDIDHIAWVHRATALRKGRADFLVFRDIPLPEEAPWGWTHVRRPRAGENIKRDVAPPTFYFMPNSQAFGVRTRAKGFEHRDLWDTKITWQVPVNDGTFCAFDVTHTPLEGEEAITYAASRAEQQEKEALTRWDIAEKILAGEMTIEEIPDEISGYNGFAIEDYVTQVGQGPIAGRKENLVQTDASVSITRRLWLREVTAMMAGKPLTQWDVTNVPSPMEVA